jgi:uncharacterized protein YyaL (SSP411 family)
MIVAWNSLMISGLARAYSVFREPEYLELATGAAKFILDNQWVQGRFHRLNYDCQPSVLAQSEDYALFIKALLDLHQLLVVEQGVGFLHSLKFNFQPSYARERDSGAEEFDGFLWRC